MEGLAMGVTDVEKIAQALGDARVSGEGWICRCPAHDDNTASLSISAGKQRDVIFHCHAGCDFKDVQKELIQRGLLPKPAPMDYTYEYGDGSYAFTKRRSVSVDGKKSFRCGVVGEKYKNGWKGGIGFIDRKPLYRLSALHQFSWGDRVDKGVVFICEGEKDVDRLVGLGLTATCNFDGAGNGKWKDHYTAEFKGLNVVVLPDNDLVGRKHATEIVKSLLPVVRSIRVLEFPGLKEHGDVSDWLNAGGDPKTLGGMIQAEMPITTMEDLEDRWSDWRDRWHYTNGKNPTPLKNSHNIAVPLLHAPELKKKIKFNLFSSMVDVMAPMPWDAAGEEYPRIWRDTDDTELTIWLNQQGLNCSEKQIRSVVISVAFKNPYDDLVNYLEGIDWDGVPRIDNWLKSYCYAEGPEEYLTAVGSKWLIGAAARGLNPGVKCDTILVLEGTQGRKKSSMLSTLAVNDKWFKDGLSHIGHKDAKQELLGHWIVEISELEAMSKAEVGNIKEFISCRNDKFRPPYGRTVQEFPRRCAMAGTFNPTGTGYLKDSSGGRRFWPVTVERDIDLTALERDRDQLWAEAVVRYKQGDKWWIEDKTILQIAQQEQDERYAEDLMAEEVKMYITHEPIPETIDGSDRIENVGWRQRPEPLDKFFPADFWMDRFTMDTNRVTRVQHIVVAQTLAKMGWEKTKLRHPVKKKVSAGWKPKVLEKEDGVTVTGNVVAHASVTSSGGVTDGVTEEVTAQVVVNSGTTTGLLPVTPKSSITNNIERNREVVTTTVYPIESTNRGGVTVTGNISGNLALEDSPEDATSILVVTDISEAKELIRNICVGGVVGMDFETVGLRSLDSPEVNRVRLAQFWRDGDGFIVDLDCVGGLSAIADVMEGGHFVVWNASFEMRWMQEAGCDVMCEDGMMAWAAISGATIGLDVASLALLDVKLDKQYQKSNWHGELSRGQLEYALKDAEVAWLLWNILNAQMEELGVWGGYELLRNATRPVIEMERSGMQLDLLAHRRMIHKLERGHVLATSFLERRVPAVKNWNSPKQIAGWVRQVMPVPVLRRWPRTKSGALSTGGDALRELFDKRVIPAQYQRIFAVFLLRQKRGTILKTFGEGLARKVINGRIYGSFAISRARTGRMSSSGPNLQNMPNSNAFRGLFVAPAGRKMVICDYSQVEVRAAAELADERVLKEMFSNGEDMHQATAAVMFKVSLEKVTKRQRAQAKVVTFGQQYGMGAALLAKRLKVSQSEADTYIDSWEKKYPTLNQWRKEQYRFGREKGYLITAGARRVDVGKNPAPSVCYNYPVQGAAADVIYAALAILEEMLRSYPSKILAVVHDEIVVEVEDAAAENVALIVEDAMTQGFLQIFPGADTNKLVDASIGSSWAAK